VVVLAGLPFPVCGAVAKSIETRLAPTPRVIYQPSGDQSGDFYREPTVEMLIRSISDYAVRQIKASVMPPVPQHIFLAYVPSADEERLLREFEFFAFPVRLERLSDFDEHGRQLRKNQGVAEQYTITCLEQASAEFSAVKRRLSSGSTKEPLLLPPRNFFVSAAERMADVYKDITHARLPWSDPINRLQRVMVTAQDLPRNIRPDARKEVFSDHRGLFFPHDRSEHGPARELAENCSHEERKLFLRSCYRFGVPLENGYHHDVQFISRGLNQVEFECSVAGTTRVTGTHANIYPNDYVRT